MSAKSMSEACFLQLLPFRFTCKMATVTVLQSLRINRSLCCSFYKLGTNYILAQMINSALLSKLIQFTHHKARETLITWNWQWNKLKFHVSQLKCYPESSSSLISPRSSHAADRFLPHTDAV